MLTQRGGRIVADKLYFKDGKLVLRGNAIAMGPDCCCGATLEECTVDWAFRDAGFIDGGQDGALREYENPGDVTASPWTEYTSPIGLRLDWEDSYDWRCCGEGCATHNPNTQYADATGTFTLAQAGYLRIEWEGMAEQEDSGFERMQIWIDGELVAQAMSPGGKLGCAPMAPIVSRPPGPVCFYLQAGEHTILVEATTYDPLYHVGSYYKFRMACGVGPCTTDDGTSEKPCCEDEEGKPGASFVVTDLPGACHWQFTSTSTLGECSEYITCEWLVEITTTGFEGSLSFDPSEDCEIVVNLLDCDNEWAVRPGCDDLRLCDEKSVKVTLIVRDDQGCSSTSTQTFTCGGGCPDWCADVTILPTATPCEFEICFADAYLCGDPFFPYCPHRTPRIDWEVPGIAAGTLLEGECDTITLEADDTLFWTLFDDLEEGSCQIGETNIVPLECGGVTCSCCFGEVTHAYVTVSGWAEFDNCAGCPSVNRTYELIPDSGGGGACFWAFTTITPGNEEYNFPCGEFSPGVPLLVGIEVFLRISCNSPEPGKAMLEVWVYASGVMYFAKIIDLLGPIGEPADCSEFQGDVPQNSGAFGGCNPLLAAVEVELVGL